MIYIVIGLAVVLVAAAAVIIHGRERNVVPRPAQGLEGGPLPPPGKDQGYCYLSVWVAGRYVDCRLEHENPLTVWVAAPGGIQIKRHKRKHIRHGGHNELVKRTMWGIGRDEWTALGERFAAAKRALATVNSSEDSSLSVGCEYKSYSRVSVSRKPGAWEIGADQVTNAPAIAFPPVAGRDGQVTFTDVTIGIPKEGGPDEKE